MAGTGFTARSMAQTKAALKAAEVKVAAAAPTAENAGAGVVAREMQSRAPVRTGALRASIHAEGSSAVADVPYAIPVDRGTDHMAAQPFAETGAKAAEPGVVAAMTAVFRTALGGR